MRVNQTSNIMDQLHPKKAQVGGGLHRWNLEKIKTEELAGKRAGNCLANTSPGVVISKCLDLMG